MLYGVVRTHLADFLEHARGSGLVPDALALHLYDMLVGAVGLLFSQAPERHRLTATDPTMSEATIEAHAEAVGRLFFRARWIPHLVWATKSMMR